LVVGGWGVYKKCLLGTRLVAPPGDGDLLNTFLHLPDDFFCRSLGKPHLPGHLLERLAPR